MRMRLEMAPIGRVVTPSRVICKEYGFGQLNTLTTKTPTNRPTNDDYSAPKLIANYSLTSKIKAKLEWTLVQLVLS